MRFGLALALIAAGSAGFAVVWGVLDASTPKPIVREFTATYAAGTEGVRTLVKGWSAPEAWGVWSLGPAAEIDWQVKGRPLGNLTATVEARSYSPPGARGSQLVDVVVNAVKVATLRFNTEEQVRDGTFQIPADIALSRSPMRIVFRIDRPTSPREFNAAPDDRALGFGLQRLSLSYQPAELSD